MATATRTWTVQLADGSHTVQLEHSEPFGKVKAVVDGQPVRLENSRSWERFLSPVTEHQFSIGRHPCAIMCRSEWVGNSYDLAVDGRSILTGQLVTRLEAMPLSAWAFASVCLVLGVAGMIYAVTVHRGAISAGLLSAVSIGVGYAAARECLAISLNASQTSGQRLIKSLGVTLAFCLFIATIIVVRSLR